MTYNDRAAEIVRQLAPWQGGRAEPWAFTVSHQHLEIRIIRPGSPARRRGNVHLVCEGCHRVSFRSLWGPINIEIEVPSDGTAFRYPVRDGDNLYVECELLNVMYDVAPVH